jgi:hypothetical protein
MNSPALRLLVFLCLLALGPLVLRFSNHVTPDDEDSERLPASPEDAAGADLHLTPELLARRKPAVIFMGNSMINTRIDDGVFTSETGYPSTFVSKASTATAVWYLYLKNIIAPLAVKPKVVVIFFRDRFLTWPTYRTTGIYGAYFESLRLGREPVVERVLWNPAHSAPHGLRDRFNYTLRAAYGIGNQPANARGVLTDLAFDLTGFGVGKATRRSRMAIRFGLDNLRPDLGNDIGSDVSWESAKSPIAFSPSPDASFLPHMLALARENGFTLFFYRVKRRCDVDGDRGDDPQLAPYLADLSHFIRENGGFFADESEAPIPALWYSDGDHIAKSYRPDYTRLFWKNTRLILEPLISAETR